MINIDVFKDISYGMYIVGTLDGKREVGCIVNSIMQITSQNPIIAISINNDNYTKKCIEETKIFSVSVLTEEVDKNVISTFGFSSSKDNNKWENIESIKVNNMPVLKASCGYMICEIVDKIETDTHTVFLGKVIQADKLLNDVPMTYRYYHNVIKGKSPKTAPSYVEEKEVKNKYVCDVCGYVYNGDIPFEELPYDYKCPICGVGKEHFKKQ